MLYLVQNTFNDVLRCPVLLNADPPLAILRAIIEATAARTTIGFALNALQTPVEIQF
jgi:hypothetical protein